MSHNDVYDYDIPTTDTSGAWQCHQLTAEVQYMYMSSMHVIHSLFLHFSAKVMSAILCSLYALICRSQLPHQIQTLALAENDISDLNEVQCTCTVYYTLIQG